MSQFDFLPTLEFIRTTREADKHIADVEQYLKQVKARRSQLEVSDKKAINLANKRSACAQYAAKLIRKGHHKPFEKAAEVHDTFPEFVFLSFRDWLKPTGLSPRLYFVASCCRRGLSANDTAAKWKTVTGKQLSKRTIERDVRKIKTGLINLEELPENAIPARCS